MTPDQGAPCARLCHIVKWDDFDGYGFNLHAEKGKSGQFIGKVDEGSPSEAAGLRQGDRIVEVNEINISSETHKQVVERIKAFPAETKLLVVDQRADDYFKANNIPIKGTMPGVCVFKTPERSPLDQEEKDREQENELPEQERELEKDRERRQNGTEHKVTNDTHSIGSAGDAELQHHENGNGSGVVRHEDDDNTSEKSTASGKEHSNGGSLNLAMSAKELRAKLAMRKKYDPKKESLGFKDKFDIVQKL